MMYDYFMVWKLEQSPISKPASDYTAPLVSRTLTDKPYTLHTFGGLKPVLTRIK